MDSRYSIESIWTKILQARGNMTVPLPAPLGYLLSLCGLTAFWLTFPLSDTLTVVFGLFLLRRVYKDFMREDAPVGRCP